MKTQKELRAAFWEMLKESAPELAELYRTKKRQNDYPTDIRCAWVDYTDGLHRSGEISEKLANRATL